MHDLVDFTFDQETVRVVLIGEEPWFVAHDVARVLGYTKAPDMVRNLDDDERATHIVRSTGSLTRDQDMTVISESGLYAAILKSRKPEAKRFRRWVTAEVLPTLRKTGRYILHPEPPIALAPAIDEGDIPRITAALGVIREARFVWGREDCRQIWMRLGLPSPIAEASGAQDVLAQQVLHAVDDLDRVLMPDLAQALGMTNDMRTSVRLGAALRLLGWESKKERVDGVPRYVWRPRHTRPATATTEAAHG